MAKKNSKSKTSSKTSPRKASPRKTAAQKQKAQAIYDALLALYPDAHCALDHRNAWELLVATILSAQCTDVRVNKVTPALFKKYRSPKAFANAKIEELEELVRTTGFYRNKAKNIKAAATLVTDEHDGDVPQTMDELLTLPGVARKTANVVLGNAFDINVGVVVDTHVTRLSNRLGLTRHSDAVKIERDLIPLFHQEQWTMLSHLLIEHGRAVCSARKPKCDDCTLAELCPKVGVAKKKAAKKKTSKKKTGKKKATPKGAAKKKSRKKKATA